jgi:hypothetical protein
MVENQPSQISLTDWAESRPSGGQNPVGSFRDACAQALQTLDLPAGYAAWQQNKAALILKLGNQPVLGITETRDGWRIQIRSGRLAAEQAGLLSDLQDDVLLSGKHSSAQLVESLGRFFEQVIDQGVGERFACCSMYRQCSAAAVCIQPDRTLALACAYRLNLKRGKVYFA